MSQRTDGACGCVCHNTGRTVKVVYNACFGGFSLSAEVMKMLNKSSVGIRRDDPALVEVVEKLGKRANGQYAELRVKTVTGPYQITYYDGAEDVETPNDIECENT